MTLANLSDLLTVSDISTPALLDELVAKQLPAISLALLDDSIGSPEALKLLDKAYNIFRKSGAGNHFFRTDKYTNGIDILLDLFGLAYERIGHGRLSEIQAYVRAYSLQKRLKALAIIHNESGFSKEYYSKNFPKVVTLLSEAQYDPGDASADYTGHVLRILHLFKKQGKQNLQKHAPELKIFLELFTDKNNIARWPLLAEDIEPVVTLSELHSDFDSSHTPQLPLSFSKEFNVLFETLVSLPLRNDPRTKNRDLRSPLGNDSQYSRKYVIEHGTADFRVPFGSYSEYDRVMIYCHYNLRLHYTSTYYIYHILISSIPNIDTLDQRKPVFLDLGCGPLTSGLALADLFLRKFGKPMPLSYIGVDIAPAMIKKAKEFASDKTLFANFNCYFSEDLDSSLKILADELKIVDNLILINASYLFASSSLNVTALASFVSQIAARCQNSPIYFIFQNPDKLAKNIKYELFKNIATKLKLIFSSTTTVTYNLPTSREPSHPDPVYYELLSYQR